MNYVVKNATLKLDHTLIYIATTM